MRALWTLAAACVLAAAASACGKKGAPLPPVVHVPDAVRQMTARRVGGDVVLTLTLPTQNVDGSTPLDLSRVEVYGYTGRSSPPLARFTEVATLVAALDGKDGGPVATLRDTLTPEELLPGPQLPRALRPLTPTAPEPRGPLKRFYLAVTFGDRRRAGPPSPIVQLPLTPLPDPPADLRATHTADEVALAWEPSGGLIGFLLDLAAPAAASPLDEGPSGEAGDLPVGPTRYNVYRETATDPAAGKGNASVAAPPAPLNQSPIEGHTFADPLQADWRRRCYVVTAVRGTGDLAVEGRPSAPECITPIDTFSPAPPSGLSPIAAEGSISLVWEANRERDLRGYVVLRGEAGDATLTPVTDQVITETRFTDRTVRPGVRYVYAVTAVDTQTPQPNVSAESEHVEVTAR